MDTFVAVLVQSLTFAGRWETPRAMGLVVAVMGGILAAWAAWYATDRVIAWRQGPEGD